MTTPDPFELWWESYPGYRKRNKKKCREKFEKHAIEIQREIYTGTKSCEKHHPDWQDPQFICAPEVFLNQEMWKIKITTTKHRIRDTTQDRVDPRQFKFSLERMRDQLKSQGMNSDADNIDKQISRL